MKQKITILTAAILLIASTLNATVWRVNNRPNVDADFTTLQAAIDGAADGDTLYIGASETSYGTGIFAKKLIVIGAGYWLAENDTTQAYTEESQTGRLTFNEGSQGSVVQGLYIYEILSMNPRSIIINADNITISKNFIRTHETNSSISYFPICIHVPSNQSDIKIEQNWMYSLRTANYPTFGIYIGGVLSNSKISNNFIQATSFTKYSIYMTVNSTATELIINNNTFWGNLITYYTIHNNNILIEGTYNNGAGDLTSHNLCNGTQYPATNNNQQNVDMSTVFVDYVGYIDNDYILAPGSPAIGAGINGGDCGPFGNGTGGDPYVLSGIPPIPTVFEATVTTMGSSVLPINIKASSHN